MVLDKIRWLEGALGWGPDWMVALGLLALATLLALGLHALLDRLLAPIARRAGNFAAILLERTRGPARLAFVILAWRIVLPPAPLGGAWQDLTARLLTLGLVALLGWIAVRAVDIGSALYLRRFRMDADDNLLARKHVTQIRILRRAATTLVILVTVAAGLMTFDTVRQYGLSLFASAGAAGLVVGLAARPLLSNLIAGVQLAVTQPIRIGDSVVVETEFGQIEEITSTYVVVRLWDLRRMVLPLSYFFEKPFQNWTRDGTALLGSVVLHVDYSAPVERIRAKFREIVEASPLWDGTVANLQVDECRERTVALKAVVGARDAAAAGDLRAEVREKLIAFLQAECPGALPRTRGEVALASLPGKEPGVNP